MGVEMKGAIRTIESCIATFLIFSFVVLLLPKPSINLEETKYTTTYYALKSILTSGIVDNSIKQNNISEISFYISKAIPWDFDIFLETSNISCYIINTSEKIIDFYVDKEKVNSITFDLLSPQQQKINITLNSKLIYSFIASEIYGIDITEKVKSGNNQLKIEKSGNKELYLILKLSYENKTAFQISSQKVSVMFPYFIEEVKYVYVLV